MQNLLWYLPLLPLFWPSSFFTGAAVLNKPFLPTSIIQPQNSTKSFPLGAVPVEFKAEIQSPRGPKLSGILCLTAAVLTISEHLALEDFTGRIQAQGWISNKLVIGVFAKEDPGNTVERRYVIWGMYMALGRMVREMDFRSAVYVLKWRGAQVGSLAFYPKDFPGLGAQNHSAITITELVLSGSTNANGSTPTVPNALGESDLSLTFSELLPPRPLDRYELFLNLIATLMEAAEHSANEIIRDSYETHLGLSDIRVTITGQAGSEPPSRPPFLKYGWIIRAVAIVPSSLARIKLYNAFQVGIYLDYIYAAEVTVDRRHVSGSTV